MFLSLCHCDIWRLTSFERIKRGRRLSKAFCSSAASQKVSVRLLLLKAYYGAETANKPMQYRFNQISHVLHIHAASMLVELYFCRASILDRKHRAGLNIHLATQRNQSITSSRRCFLKAKQVLKKYRHLMSLVNGSIASVSDIRI